jgi:hypothetical protein
MQTKNIRLGVIGMSEGNGHPYSWSAICNGYDVGVMKECSFPSIPDYLAKQQWPEAQISNARVTHVWTQDLKISKHIAAATNISTVVERVEEMIGSVDAILLARDDAENHARMVSPFLKAGLPVFVDKPFALSRKDASAMLDQQQFDTQLFTCSSLRYAQELQLSKEDIELIGKVKWIEASVMKKWDTYAVHAVEPIVAQFGNRGKLKDVKPVKGVDTHLSLIEWENLLMYVKVTGNHQVPLAFTFFGERGTITKTFQDSFNCFKRSIQKFIEQIETGNQIISRSETLEITDIIEWGRR